MRPVADIQIVRGVAATLTVQFVDQNGTAAGPSGMVTIGITKADGTVLVAAGTATTTPTDTTTRTYALAAVNTLELLTAAWTDGGDSSTITQLVEIVGGVYFTPADARALDSSLTADQYSDANIVTARRQVEEQFEEITGVAWVPRYRRARLDGDYGWSVALPDPMIRSVRSLRFYTNGTDYSSLDAAALAALAVGDGQDARAGVITRTDLGIFFPVSSQSVVVEYEFGLDRPPSLLKRAAIIYCRHMLNDNLKTGVGDRADSFQLIDGGVIRYAQPGRAGYHTGIAFVDQVLDQYSLTVSGIA